jgi:hypothetical protein
MASSVRSAEGYARIYCDACRHQCLLADAYAEAAPDARPGLILLVQTFGDLANFKAAPAGARRRRRVRRRAQAQHSIGAMPGGAKSAANRCRRSDARNEAGLNFLSFVDSDCA